MKVKLIQEGYFKNPEQMKAEKERRLAMTDTDRAIKTAATITNSINRIINTILKKRSCNINPFSISSTFIGGSAVSDTGWGETKVEKREVSCIVERDSTGKNIITVDLDLGRLVDKSNNKPFYDLMLNLDYDELHLKTLNKNKIKELFEKKIKNAVKKEYQANKTSTDKPFFEFILNSDIVLDNIFLYKNVQGNEPELTMSVRHHTRTNKHLLSKLEENHIVGGFSEKFDPITEEGRKRYEKALEALMNVVTFGKDFKFYIVSEREINDNSKYFKFYENPWSGEKEERPGNSWWKAIMPLFAQKNISYKTLGELEDAAGISGAIETLAANFIENSIKLSGAPKYDSKLKKELDSGQFYNQVAESFQNCNSFFIQYFRIYQYLCSTNSVKFLGENEPIIVSLQIINCPEDVLKKGHFAGGRRELYNSIAKCYITYTRDFLKNPSLHGLTMGGFDHTLNSETEDNIEAIHIDIASVHLNASSACITIGPSDKNSDTFEKLIELKDFIKTLDLP